MALALWHCLSYFIKGLQACLYGFYRIVEIDRETKAAAARAEAAERANRTDGVFANRRVQRAGPPAARAVQPGNFLAKLGLCCFYNGVVILGTIVTFQYICIPLLTYISGLPIFVAEGDDSHAEFWEMYTNVLVTVFQVIWVVPLFLIGRFINTIWFSEIAEQVWLHSRRKTRLPGIGHLIADLSFSAVMQVIFLGQSMVASFIPLPLIGHIVSLVLLALLYSLYAFEYRWLNQGYNISKRIALIEHQWPYFVGFGLPVAYLTSLTDNMFVNGAVFSLLFPLLIVSANEAVSIKQNFEVPIRFFALAMAISNSIFQHDGTVVAVGKYILSKTLGRMLN